MNVFVVRPFAEKSFIHKDGNKVSIDFDEVHRALIAPVLQALELPGGTTAEIVRAGNIRADMFQRLLTADVVIADISIHNANVYYELGVRHALRERRTVLIRARADEVPFDLKTDRYLEYDAENPGASVLALTAVLEATIAAHNADSPIYQMLPDLIPPDPAIYLAVPSAYRVEVECARATHDLPLLGLLAEEARRQPWHLQALRLIGRAQFHLRAFHTARHSWERVYAQRPDDPEANLILGTIYERLGELTRSSQSLARALRNPGLSERQRSEACALQARNLKVAWIAAWRSEPPERRRECALRSGLLQEALDAYQRAFEEDLDHYYPGLNALAMSTIQIELAKAEPEAWAARFEEPEEAATTLRVLQRRRSETEGAVRIGLRAASRRVQQDERVWLDISRADLRVLTSDRPAYVRAAYADARARVADRASGGIRPDFPAVSAARQVRLLLDLGILEDNARAALEELDVAAEEPPAAAVGSARDRIVVATGHRIDTTDRATPRFPRTPEAQRAAHDAFRAALEREIKACEGSISGLAGAASGADIVFLEVCEELGVAVRIVLPIPEGDYLRRSVADAGGDWVERFRRLCRRHTPQVLAPTDELPTWVRDRTDYSVFQRGNIWMLEHAFSREETDVTLIALWNGQRGDGPGGTEDMIRLARSAGAKFVHLDTCQLFGLQTDPACAE